MAKKSAPRRTKVSKRPSSKAKTKKTSPKGRKSTARNTRATTKSTKSSDQVVTIDRRRVADRRGQESAPAVEIPLERRQKVQRRRQIDPTTCERDYSVQEVEFMNAMDEYKRKSGRMFPTCSEVLEVIRGLNYVQLAPAEVAAFRSEQFPTDEQPNPQPEDEAEAF